MSLKIQQCGFAQDKAYNWKKQEQIIRDFGIYLGNGNWGNATLPSFPAPHSFKQTLLQKKNKGKDSIINVWDSPPPIPGSSGIGIDFKPLFS